MLKKKVVIIIEDNKHWLRKLRGYIANLDCEIESYESFDKAEDRLTGKKTYDLVVTDIYKDKDELLEKSRGLDLAKFVSKKKIPVIVVSGKEKEIRDDIDDIMKKVMDFKAFSFFWKKGFDKLKYIDAVKEALELENEEENKQPLSPSPWGYALISLVSLIIGIGLLILLIQKGEELRNVIVYYLLLIPFGLCCAAFLFGVMRSYATYKGKLLRGAIDLRGPVVIFALVVGFGVYVHWNVYSHLNDAKPFSLTVYVHGPQGQTDVVLENKGEVVLYLGGDTLAKRIEENGKAVFPSIPGNFRNKKVLIRLRADGYTLSDPNREYILKPPCIYIEVAKR